MFMDEVRCERCDSSFWLELEDLEMPSPSGISLDWDDVDTSLVLRHDYVDRPNVTIDPPSFWIDDACDDDPEKEANEKRAEKARWRKHTDLLRLQKYSWQRIAIAFEDAAKQRYTYVNEKTGETASSLREALQQCREFDKAALEAKHAAEAEAKRQQSLKRLRRELGPDRGFNDHEAAARLAKTARVDRCATRGGA